MKTIQSSAPASVLPFRGRRCRSLICAASIALFAGTQTVHSATRIWIAAPTDANWSTAANWGGTAPGVATGSYVNSSLNTDIAQFNAAIGLGGFGGAGSPIVIDANRFLQSLSFAAGAGSYVIGATGGNFLLLQNGGNITVAAGVTSAEVVNAPLQFHLPSSTNGTYSFVNNSTTTAATLTIGGTVSIANSTRPLNLTLDGTNTGSNTISGVITLGSSTATNLITKQGTGTWVLSGANVFTGAAATTAANGIQINGGTLSAQNNAALGTNGTANTNQVSINNTGTLEITTGITLDNGLSLNLNNGGTIRGVGAAGTNGRINVGTAAATSVTLSTVNAGDVFTVGNLSGDFVGGAADTVTHVAGPGTVFNGFASTNYLGGWSIDAGTLRVGSSTNGLGSAGVVTFGSGSTGKLQLNANDVTLTSLTTNATPGSAVIENGAAGTNTLTVNNASANTFAGVLQNGSAGTLKLTKGGAGTLTLSGNSSTYSGATTISAGVLNVTNTAGSATGTSAVALNAATLTGAGFITGTVTTAATSIITPGTVTAGSAGSGVLTLGNLTLTGGTTMNYGLVAGTATNNYLSTGTLTLPGAGTVTLNLYTPGTSNPFAAAGTYDLFQYTTLGGGALSGAFLVGTSIAGYTPTFATSGGFVQLTLTASGVIGSWTNGNATGNWNDAGNWSGGIPSLAGSSATFASAPGAVTLNANETVGGLTFNNAAGYTITGGNTLTLDNNGSGASVTVTTGSHTISTAVAFNDNVTVAPASGTQLTISGNISQATGSSSLTKTGTGTLVLSGTNSYSGGTSVSNGVLNFNGLSALGSASTLALGSATTNGTLRYASGNTADVSTLTVTLNAGGGTIDTNGNNVTFANAIGNSGAGGLTKAGSGTLTLSGANTYTGATTLTAGTLNISSDAALGSAATNLTFDPGAGNTATLQAGANVNLSATRSLVLNSGTAALDTQANTVTLNGASSGSGVLAKSGSGTLTIAAGQGYTGGTVINAGKLNIQFGGSLTNGITLNNGSSLAMTQVGANSLFFGNAITVNGTTTFSSAATANGYFGLLTGDASSVIDLAAGTQALNFSASATKQFTNFLGTVNVLAGASMDTRGTTAANGGDNTTFSVDGFVSSKNAGSWTFGALTSTGATGTLGGTDNYIVGAKNLSTTYAGNITTNAATGLTKNGTGTLTLTGSGNTYTGTTLISVGTLQIGAGGSIGSLGTGSVTDNATLTFNRSDAVAVSNGITGTGLISLINSTGTVNYTGTASVANLFVKAGTFAIGTGGSVTTSNFGGPGVAAGDNGIWTVLGTGSYTSNGDFNVGDTGSTTVAATGILNIQDTALVTIGTNGGLYVGSAFTATGDLGIGTVNQTGGTFTDNDTANGTFVIGGRNFNTGTGTYNLSAGTATLKGLGYVGGAGTGTLNISGTGVFDAQAGLRLANNSNGQTGSAGTVNLDSGTLTATSVSAGAGTSTFNFNGGTLKADAASTTFMTGLTTANVRNGGAIIDTGVNNITIGQALVHSTIGGDNATDGGLTKTGNGTLTLSGANTYTGVTTVSIGTLVAVNATALGTAAAGTTIASGATLDVQASIGAEAISVSGTGVGGNGALVAGAGTGTVGGAVTMTADTRIGGAGTLNVTGAIAGAFTLTKVGLGITTLSGAQTYAVLTTSAGTTNVNSAVGTGSSTINADATTHIHASQTLAALNIADGVEVTFGDGLPFVGGAEKFGAPALVPEPGSMGLLLVGALGLLGRRRRS